MIFRTVDLVRRDFVSELNRVKRGQRRAYRAVLLEALEGRQLLSAAAAPAGFYNLTGNLVSSTIPADVMAGQTVSGVVTVAVDNAGTLALSSGHKKQQVTIEIVAHNTGSLSDTVLTTSKPLNVSQIAPGGSQDFAVDVKKAPAIAGGDYTLAAVITPVPALSESSTTDNRVTTTAGNLTLTLHVGSTDITGTLGGTTLPSAVVAGSKPVLPGKLDVVLENNSDVALPKGEQVMVVVKAHNTVTNADVVVGVDGPKRYSVSGLGAGSSITLEANVHLSGKTLPAGTYTLEAQITPVQRLVESSTANNLVTLNAAGLPITITSGAATADLTGTLGASTVVSGASSTMGNLTITVTNSGNLPIAAGQAVSFAIAARPVGASGSSSDVALTTAAQNFTLPALKPGKSATFTVSVNSNIMLVSGVYDLLATITATGLTEPAGNNVASQTAAGATVTVTSTNMLVFAGGTSIGSTTVSSVLTNFNSFNFGTIETLGGGTIDLTDLSDVLNNFGTSGTTLTTASGVNAYTGGTTITNATAITVGAFTTLTGTTGAGGVLTLNGASGIGNLSNVVTNNGTATVNLVSGTVDGATTIDSTNLSSGVINVLTSGSTLINTATTVLNGLTSGSFTLNGSTFRINNGVLGNLTLVGTNPIVLFGGPLTVGSATAALTFTTFSQGTVVLPVSSVDVTNADGTVTLSNLTINGSPVTFDVGNIVSHVANVSINGGGHTISFQTAANATSGNVTVDGTVYAYSNMTSSAGTLTLSVTTPATTTA